MTIAKEKKVQRCYRLIRKTAKGSIATVRVMEGADVARKKERAEPAEAVKLEEDDERAEED